jgi:hypothetical protein
MNITYEDILSLENLNDFQPEQVVSMLAIIFETGRERQDVEGIKKGLEFAEIQRFKNWHEHDKMIFHYNVANGWSYLQMLTQEINSEEFWAFELKELEKQIINLRSSLIYFDNVEDNFNKCQILTNLGNLLSHIGRFSESILYWQLALEKDPEFPMAIGNIGFGLFHYAGVLYDPGHQSLFLKLAYKYLTQAIEYEIHEEAKNGFNNIIEKLESHNEINKLKDLPDFNDFDIGDTEAEKFYRKWCLKNHLFLNPLNDIITENIASHDCLHLPPITAGLEDPPTFHTIYNQIKQEFVSARYLLYEGITFKDNHFSDKGNLQMDTLDYAVYSFNTEKIKIAYRLFYSILDKIAYLLNLYLKLGFKPSSVSFRGIWYEYQNRKPIGLNKKITESQNWAFRGLYWLSKDFYESKLSLSSMEPDAIELSKIRNFLEHKSFKLVDMGETKLADNGYTYLINRYEFEDKTFKLIKLVRAAIIYISLGLNIEEIRNKNDNPKLPVDFVILDDEYKT